jgi:hypothetical protein
MILSQVILFPRPDTVQDQENIHRLWKESKTGEQKMQGVGHHNDVKVITQSVGVNALKRSEFWDVE